MGLPRVECEDLVSVVGKSWKEMGPEVGEREREGVGGWPGTCFWDGDQR